MATLFIGRAPGESVLIDLSSLGLRQPIRITLELPPMPGSDCRLKIEAPQQVKILREELAIRDSRRRTRHVMPDHLPPRPPGSQQAGTLD